MKFNVTMTIDYPDEQELSNLRPDAKSFLYEKSLQEALDGAVKKMDISQTSDSKKKLIPNSYKISVKSDK